MAAKTAKAVAVLMTVLMVVLMGESVPVQTVGVAAARVDNTPTPPETRTGVWDAYPSSVITMCAHVPRRPIDFNQLNGVWHIVEMGGIQEPVGECESNFRVEEGENLTLVVSNRNVSEGTFNLTWIMTDDNVWRDYDLPDQPFMFLGWSTDRSLLLLCMVNSFVGASRGMSAALARDPQLVRNSELAAARLPGRQETIKPCPSPD